MVFDKLDLFYFTFLDAERSEKRLLHRTNTVDAGESDPVDGNYKTPLEVERPEETGGCTLSLHMYWVVRDFAATYTEQGTFPSLFYAHLISRYNFLGRGAFTVNCITISIIFWSVSGCRTRGHRWRIPRLWASAICPNT